MIIFNEKCDSNHHQPFKYSPCVLLLSPVIFGMVCPLIFLREYNNALCIVEWYIWLKWYYCQFCFYPWRYSNIGNVPVSLVILSFTCSWEGCPSSSHVSSCDTVLFYFELILIIININDKKETWKGEIIK